MDNSAQVAGLKQKIDQYSPSDATIELVKNTPILLLVGVSGAGKGSIQERLLETDGYHSIVSHTTRKPRENDGVMEQNGREYHFIDLAEAEKMLDDGAFVEAKFYSGNVYGTSAAEIQRSHDEHRIAMTDIEVQGIAEYEAIKPDIMAVYVVPPSYELWQERLRKRYDGRVDAADLERRMKTAKLELQEALIKPYYRFVINDDLTEAAKIVDAIAHGSDTKNDEAAKNLAHDLLAKL